MYAHDFKAETLQGLLKQRNVVVWVGEVADLAAIRFVSDKKRQALLGERGRIGQNKSHQENE